MRDIRSDIRERLETLKAKRESLQRQLASLSGQEDMLLKLLADEESIFARFTPPLFEGTGDKPQGSPLSQVLLDVLKVKSAPASLSELTEAAVNRGVPFGEKKPGRVIHFAMLGMAQHKLVERRLDGKWELVAPAVN